MHSARGCFVSEIDREDERVVGALGRSTGRSILGVTAGGEDQVVDAWEGRRAAMARVKEPLR